MCTVQRWTAMSGHSASSAFSRPGAPSTTTSSGVGNPQLMRSSSSARQAASLSPPMLLIASSIFWPSARTPSATRDRGRLSVEPDTRDRLVEDQPYDRLFGERARIPGVPVALRLAPDAADHVLANRPGKHRVQRAPHPAGVGPREISPGDQAVGRSGSALVGAQRTAPPLARLAVLACQSSARHGDPRLAKRARQRPLARPVAHADNRRRRLVLPRSAPAVARTRQRLGKLPPPASSR